MSADPTFREWTFPITKAEMQADGSLLVEGTATSEELDNTEPIPEIVDFDNAKACMEAWPGNVREMHQLKAVGKSVGWWPDDDRRLITLRTRVSAGAPDTIAKVLDGTLNSYSVAGPPLKRTMETATKADGTKVPANRLYYKRFSEISLVDRGCNPQTRFSIVKADGAESEFSPRQYWSCGTVGHEHVGKAEAQECSERKVESMKELRFSIAQDEGKFFVVDEKGLPVDDVEFSTRGEASSHMRRKVDGSDVGKAAVREDVSDADKERAKKEYGDVEFADEKNKKYPVDTPGHIRAAWNYISKAKNAAKYDAADVKRIKAKIVAAWKKKIDKDGPPSASEEGKAMKSDALKAFVEKAAKLGVALVQKKVSVDAAGGDVKVGDAAKVGFDPGGWAGWAGLQSQQALDALYAYCYLETVLRSEMMELESDDPEEVEQRGLIQQALDCVAEFIGRELLEREEDEKASKAEGAPEEAVKALTARVKAHISKANAQEVHDHAVSAYGAKCMDAKAEEGEAAKAEPVDVLAQIESVKADLSGVREELKVLGGENEALKAQLEAEKAKRIEEPGTPVALTADGQVVPASKEFASNKGEMPIGDEEMQVIVAKAGGDPDVVRRAVSMRLAEKGIRAAVQGAIAGR